MTTEEPATQEQTPQQQVAALMLANNIHKNGEVGEVVAAGLNRGTAWPHWAWTVVIHNNKTCESRPIKWKCGLAHCVLGKERKRVHNMKVQDISEVGGKYYFQLKQIIPTKPDPAEVFATVCRDVVSRRDAGTYERWALEFGYDPDSRKGEAIYNSVAQQDNELYQLNVPYWLIAKCAELACEF